MQQRISAQVALLAFAAAIMAGLYAGNAPLTVLSRALIVMFAALLVSQAVAHVSKRVLRDHLQGRKVAIDREHLAASASEPLEGSTQAVRPNGG